MTYKKKIDVNNLPGHIAIIMDGNGRWAKRIGNQRIFGHKNGVKAVRETIEGVAELGIEFLTLYAFSTENWNRPRLEIDALMSLLVTTLVNETPTLMENNIRLTAIGATEQLSDDVSGQLDRTIAATSSNSGLNLVLALNYSGRWEIIQAVNKIKKDIEDGLLKGPVNETIFSGYLETKCVPDPELLIRTSGEYRISNFLLWQIAYSELYFTPVLWPDFRKEDLYKAIVDYQQRERRFGKISEQLSDK